MTTAVAEWLGMEPRVAGSNPGRHFFGFLCRKILGFMASFLYTVLAITGAILLMTFVICILILAGFTFSAKRVSS